MKTNISLIEILNYQYLAKCYRYHQMANGKPLFRTDIGSYKYGRSVLNKGIYASLNMDFDLL